MYSIKYDNKQIQTLLNLKPFTMFLVFVLSVLLIPSLFSVGINTLYGQDAFAELSPNLSALSMLIGYSCAYAIVLYFAKDYLSVTFSNLVAKVSVWHLLYAIFIGLLFTVAMSFVMTLIEPPDDFVTISDEFFVGTNFSRAVLILFIAVLAPIIEEFVFRGYIFDSLKSNNSFAITAVATSLLFTMPHMLDYYAYWPAAFIMFALGMLLAYFRKKHDSILPCILLHASYNGSLLLLWFASELT